MASRFVEGLYNHERLEKFSYRKYEQRSPLGQLQVMHNTQAGGTFLSVQPPIRYDISERYKSTVSASAADLPRYHVSGQEDNDLAIYKSPLERNKSAPVWVRVPSHSEMWESCARQDKTRPRQVVFSRSKSHAENHKGISRSAPARRTTGKEKALTQTNSTLYRFRPVDIKTRFSKENIHLCTALIKEQWDSRERQYLSTGIYAKGKSEAKDSKLLQWFTFEGDSPGALSAFTKEDESKAGEVSPKFSIEANVGKEVASKLVLGNKVRIGKNGKLLLGQETDDTDENSLFYERVDSVLAMTRGAAQKHEPLYPPLCWHDVEKEAKVITPKSQNGFNTEAQMNKTMPIVYHNSPNIRPYIPLGVQSDSGKLKRLLSHKPVPKQPQAEVDMSYDEILESRTPHSSRNHRTGPIVAPTPENTTVEPQKLSRTYKPPKPPSNKPSALGNCARVRTPNIPEEVKCGIQRQVTMPSYKILPDKAVDRVAGRPKTGQDLFDRAATPTRPPKYTPSYSVGCGTAPTISQNGLEGDKSFVQITSPLNQLFKYETTVVRSVVRDDERVSKTAPSYKEHKTRINNTPADLSAVTLVGKAPPIERFPKAHHKFSNQQDDESEVKESQHTTADVSTVESSLMELSHLPNRLDINIPGVDMISASSAAVNSIADFQEFDNMSHKLTMETNGSKQTSDHNNNNQSAHSHDDEHHHDSIGSSGKAPSIESFDNDVEEFSISVDISNNVHEGEPLQDSIELQSVI